MLLKKNVFLIQKNFWNYKCISVFITILLIALKWTVNFMFLWNPFSFNFMEILEELK